jgi:hypothetical protein
MSFHVLAGVSLQEDAFCISGLSSIVKGNASGAIISGIYNHVGYNGKGIQLAGIANYNGYQIKGAQIAGITNIAQNVDGAQVSGVVNIADSSKIQLSGFANLSQQSTVQTAGFINIADTVKTQIAGFINIAHKVKGVQIAGFINVADESDYPIGVVNIIKHGDKALGISVDELGTSLLSFRSGGRVTYGILGLGYNFNNNDARYVLEAGLGAHFKIAEYFRINTEITASSLTDFKGNYYSKATVRVMAGFKLGDKMEFFAGPSINYMGFDSDQNDIRKDHYLWNERKGSQYNGLFIGGTAGIQYRF